ncbi:triacylglycerol lipase [Nitrosomonas cryotolerans]|uniref:Triacylglycerol lipase n=1 Tax=Nitrosomonas cryotolerans ATCC 49181 TaxID=1131553 RepID=A0A1N6G176_9PROT|nr:alpha/beta fold hydrolase [Nitrosomonas cryotolerans]SFQ12020.1 triacylglycerol lipase [Nitrosomonas cryotolerans]SIO01227.1 triacylglycerol lipase [Nitrosomonas cryotolerans ATCC 49181]
MSLVNNNKTAIVFVHGLLGFSSISILGKIIHYFRALPPYLSNHTQSIYFPPLPGTGTVEERARVLADFLERINVDQINLIAHSMGGLDSRYAIHHFDSQQRIRSLTTIATPHRGTPLAQRIINSKKPLYSLLRRITHPALYDLTPEACARFNLEISDLPHVQYRSYAATRPANEMPPIFRPWTRALATDSGENDSQVSVSSARWGEFKGILRADHMELAGWSMGWPSISNERPFDHLRFYTNLVRELNTS